MLPTVYMYVPHGTFPTVVPHGTFPTVYTMFPTVYIHSRFLLTSGTWGYIPWGTWGYRGGHLIYCGGALWGTEAMSTVGDMHKVLWVHILWGTF